METYEAPFSVSWRLWALLGTAGLVLILALVALLGLRRRPMDEVPRFLWALLVLVAPVFGPLVFFIVRPGRMDESDRRVA